MSAAVLDAEQDDSFDRILALKQREPVDCEFESGTKRYRPATQALIEVVTAQYARPRLSCACRPRTVQALGSGRVVVFQKGVHDAPPPPPLELDVNTFVADSPHDEELQRALSRLRQGESAQLVGLGYEFCIDTLNPVQAWFLRELAEVGGVFGMVSVGGGKSGANILGPLALPHLRKWVLLAKPDQRIHYKKAYLRFREHFRVPTIIFDQQGDLDGSYVVPGAPQLHFLPYSLLSNKKSTTLFEDIDPDGVLADEVHLVANKTSARTMRWLRVMATRPRVFGCASGSTIRRSIKDVSHLALHSLGLGSPYPALSPLVEQIAAVVDPSPIPDRRSDLALRMFAEFGNKQFKETIFSSGFGGDGGICEGYRERVKRTPGIVSARTSQIDCSISIHERKIAHVPQEIIQPLRDARKGTRPDGEEVVEALDIAEMSREVAAGFYTYWAYPKSTAEERSPGGLIDQWFAARKAYAKESRSKLLSGERHLDSPKLLEEAAIRAWQTPRYSGPLPVWPSDSWPAWRDIRHKVEPDPRVRWIDDYLAKDAAQWAQENVGVVWVQSRPLGLKIAQLAGLPYHAGGPNCEAEILAEDGSRSVIASIKAHGTGRDGLQLKFNKQLFAQFPPSGDMIEQILGRLARPGQRADTVESWVYRHLSEYRDAFTSAYRLSQFIESQTNKQLLLAADCDFEV